MARYGRDSFPPGFQWDPQKYDANLKKRRVPFEVAAQVFQDPLLVEKLDLRFLYDEARFIAIGGHIISARKAFPAERRAHAKA